MDGRVCDQLVPFLMQKQETDEGRRIGTGSFGSVYQVTLNGFPCIIKRLHDILVGQNVSEDDRTAIRRRFQEECILLSTLRHPNIVQFIGVYCDKSAANELTLVMERLYTDLEKCLRDHRNIPLPLQLSILLDVAYALLYLHSRTPAVVHRDVKASNILLTNDMRAKLADLGVSKILDTHPLSGGIHTICPGTQVVMPPEALVENPSYTTKLDVFSFGTLVLHVVNHEFPRPYETMHFETGKMHIARRKSALIKMGETHCLYHLVVRCLQDDPTARPTTNKICGALESLSQQAEHKKEFEDVLQMYEAISGFETALHEANAERRGIAEAVSFHYNERLKEMEGALQRKEEEMKRVLRIAQVVHEEEQVAQQESQAKAAQVKQYKKQVDALKAENSSLEAQIGDLRKQNQKMERVCAALEKKTRKGQKSASKSTSESSMDHCPQLCDLERRIAELERLNEGLRNENDRLREAVHIGHQISQPPQESPPPLPPKSKRSKPQ